MINETKHVWAVGRNYKAHAEEMKAELPTVPMIFLKGGGTVTSDKNIKLPDWIIDVHHELELILKLDNNLEISHIGIALDLTERHFQTQAKQNGTPWTLAKSFKNSCPISPLLDLQSLKINNFSELRIELYIHNQLKQKGDISHLIFDITTLKKYILTHFPVEPNDLILTGTPAGVGSIQRGDQLNGLLIQKSQNETENRILINHSWKFN